MLWVKVINGAPLQIRVTEADRSCVYTVEEREHGAWLDLFRAIAVDFGTRRPRGREAFETPPADNRIEPLLTRNIDPRIRDGYGDPAVLRTEDGYRLVVTSNDAPDAFPILRSRDLRDWELAGFVFPRGQAPAWAITGEGVADFWAPELHRVGSGYLLCFTARNHKRELCIGLARADSPGGPFTADPEPLLTGGVIDANLFVRPDGTTLLFWKEDSNAVWPRKLARLLRDDPILIDKLFDSAADRRTAQLCAGLWRWAERATPMEQFFSLQPMIEAVVARYGQVRERLHAHSDVIAAMRTPVYAQALSPDGQGLAGERRVVLVNDLAWEGHLIEGNWVTEQQGRFYLFYSGNDFSTPDYGIGVAIADDPLGPYVKMPEPLLRTSTRWWGPGHPSVAPGPDGVPRLFFHAFPPGTGGYKAFRALLSVRLAFYPDRVEVS
ncbi:family 43 glycosylhydrolase [Sphingomonas sp. MAH-20]|uniref:Family 43 glycosylhydrolase n=1 Tax=Sphingomonas horti TaxID=2682842 RepID=A0A6I4J565_9SPHN|nr:MULTISPECIES: glycoside hydrolase family 43 protein [Sphingomonas]MBA2921245.1 family 43 glycosylhydrolase [Sphingomonas sp. CGMCC 1.13658]MVO79486.1 family 43 glycosylhydrolase [Sphingomonas horti]